MKKQKRELQKEKLKRSNKTTDLKGANVPPKIFIEWVETIMQEERFFYAQNQDVAVELAEKYGGTPEQHLNRMYKMRLRVSELRPSFPSEK